MNNANFVQKIRASDYKREGIKKNHRIAYALFMY